MPTGPVKADLMRKAHGLVLSGELQGMALQAWYMLGGPCRSYVWDEVLSFFLTQRMPITASARLCRSCKLCGGISIRQNFLSCLMKGQACPCIIKLTGTF